VVNQGEFKSLATDTRARSLESNRRRKESPSTRSCTGARAQNRRCGVVRMNLDAQVISRIDHFNHEREHAPAKPAPPARARPQRPTGATCGRPAALRDHAHAALMIRQVPRFANRPRRKVLAPLLQTSPAPHQGLVRRSKCERARRSTAETASSLSSQDKRQANAITPTSTTAAMTIKTSGACHDERRPRATSPAATTQPDRAYHLALGVSVEKRRLARWARQVDRCRRRDARAGLSRL